MKHAALLIVAAIITGCAAPEAPVDLTGLNAGWRTDGTGKYPDAEPTLEWSTEKNVVWKTPLPNTGNATPVIAGRRIFVCSEPDTVVCVAKKDGKILWKKGSDFSELLTPDELKNRDAYRQKGEELVAERNALNRKLRGIRKKLKENKDDRKLSAQQDELNAEVEKIKEELETYVRYIVPDAHPVNGHSSPTPVCDAQRVYVNFGTGVAAAYTHAGERVWMIETQKPWHSWGHSCSPVLVDGKLIIYVKDVVALDAATGREVWRFSPRLADREQPRWGALAVADVGGKQIVVTPKGDFLDAATGAVLASGVNSVQYNGPVVQDGVVYFIQHKGGAYALPGSAGDSLVLDELWTTEPKDDRYYASPVIHDGLVYAITRKMDFSVIDAADGSVVFEDKLDLRKEAYPSIVFAGGYLLVSGDKGQTVVYKPGRTPERVAVNELETFRSTPVFEGTRMYVRGYEYLYCIGK